MIWFSSRKLEKALSEGVLSNWEKAKYLIFVAVLSAMSGPVYFLRPTYGKRPPPGTSLWNLAFGLVGMFIVYHGIKRCFRTNEHIDAERFFERMACLTVPVLAKMVVFCIPASLVVLWAFAPHVKPHPESDGQTTVTLSIALGCLGTVLAYAYYWMLNRSFARLGALLKEGQG